MKKTVDRDNMTVVEFLQAEYHKQGHTVVQDWIHRAHPGISLQAVTQVLNHSKNAGVLVLVKMAAALGCKRSDIRWICEKKDDVELANLIAPEVISSEEQLLLDNYRKLSSHQQSMIMNMAQEMAK